MDGGEEEVVCAIYLSQNQAFGQFGTGLVEELIDLVVDLGGVGACGLENQDTDARVTVYGTIEAIGVEAQLDASHILYAEHLTFGGRAYDHITELLGCDLTTLVAHDVLEGLVGVLANGARCGLDILLREDASDVGGNQVVLSHLDGVHPDTHGVCATQHGEVAHAIDTLNLGLDVDVDVVGDEVLVVLVRRAGEGKDLKHRALTLFGGDAHILNGLRQFGCSRRHTVLHVDGSHIGVGALLEVDCDGGHTCVGGLRGHVGHVLDTIYGLLEGSDHTLLQSFGVGTIIGCGDRDGWGGNARELLYREREQSDDAHKNDDD